MVPEGSWEIIIFGGFALADAFSPNVGQYDISLMTLLLNRVPFNNE